MAGITITLVLAMGMLGAIWLLLKPKRRALPDSSRLPGQLSAAERRRLYQRLGIDPAALARQRRSNVIWLDPRVEEPRRSTDA
jgi:hypothetical protein